MKAFVLAFLLMFSTLASAELTVNAAAQAGWNDLTEEQKAEIINNIAKTKAVNSTPSTQASNTEKSLQVADRVVNLAAAIGRGLGSAAKEAGIAINQFLMTPAGKFTAFIIFWSYVGKQIVGISLLVIAYFVLLFAIFRGTFFNRKVVKVYSQDKTNIFGNPRIEQVTKYDVCSEYAGWGITCSIIATILFMVGINGMI